jgi:putative transposase
MNINFISNLKSKQLFSRMIAGLIVCRLRRSYVAIGEAIAVNHDKIRRFFEKSNKLCLLLPFIATRLINYHTKDKPGWLIIDDTSIAKKFAEKIEGLFDIFISSSRTTSKGFSIVVLAWSNGEITIPINFKVWLPKTVASNYKTKCELAIELVADYKDKVPFDHILMDGLYATKTVLKFLFFHNIGFIMRLRSNARITINNETSQAKKHQLLRLLRNSRSYATEGMWQDMLVQLVVVKRWCRREWQRIFLISNMNLNPKQYLPTYNNRWPIEMLFRTVKQKTGIADCMSRSFERQKGHFAFCFITYIFLQHETKISKNNNPDATARSLLVAKLDKTFSKVTSFMEQIIYA